LEVGITGHNCGRGPSKDHSTKVWLQLAQWFLRRRLKCEMLTDDDGQKSDGRYIAVQYLKELKFIYKGISMKLLMKKSDFSAVEFRL
jgi:hypothetical protein